MKESRHDPVKCGWACTRCHAHHRNPKVLGFAYCNDKTTNHKLIETEAMCKTCFEFGALESLKVSPCPKSLSFDANEKIEKSVSVPPPVVPCANEKSVSVPPPVKDLKKATSLRAELDTANLELKRLEILKSLALERQLLKDLLAKKTKVCFLFAHISIYILPIWHLEMHFLTAHAGFTKTRYAMVLRSFLSKHA